MGAEELIVDDPYSGDVAARVPLASRDEVSRVLDRARAAAAAWRDVPLADRIALSERAVAAMEARAEEIALEISRMMGKPVQQGRNEVRTMAVRARYMQKVAPGALADGQVPEEPGFARRIRKEPLGVVLDLPAWNYPLLTAVNAIVPAVIAGNAVVIKHSSRSPLCAEHFARGFREAGAPEGLVQAVHADHATTEAMVGDPRVDHVVFTGSVAGGHRIAAAASGRFMHIGFELGGNDPAYVAADCDFQSTVENVVDGAMYNAGQSCCAVERVYVHRSIYPKFAEACAALVKAYVLGDPRDPQTTMGPIAQPKHPPELAAMVADARRKGALIVTGGSALAVGGKGRFFEPTLILDATHAMQVMKEEQFGPILPLAPVDSDEEALARMNDSTLGLTCSIWTTDVGRAERLAPRLEFGTVFMNRCDYVDPALPWTGVKDTGRGHAMSALGFDVLTRPKSIHFRLPSKG